MSMITPGPGSYQTKENFTEAPVKTWGKNGVFGSTERRFVPKGNQPIYTPGPGSYIQTDVVGKQTQLAGEIKRSSSMFLSKTRRANTGTKRPEQANQVVAYDDKLYTISENVRKRVEQANNPLLA